MIGISTRIIYINFLLFVLLSCQVFSQDILYLAPWATSSTCLETILPGATIDDCAYDNTGATVISNGCTSSITSYDYVILFHNNRSFAPFDPAFINDIITFVQGGGSLYLVGEPDGPMGATWAPNFAANTNLITNAIGIGTFSFTYIDGAQSGTYSISSSGCPTVPATLPPGHSYHVINPSSAPLANAVTLTLSGTGINEAWFDTGYGGTFGLVTSASGTYFAGFHSPEVCQFLWDMISGSYSFAGGTCGPGAPPPPDCAGDISINVGNVAGGDSEVTYAYTDDEGMILGVSSGAAFSAVEAGAYYVYAVQHAAGNPPSTLTEGQSIFDITGDGCTQIAGPEFAGIGCECNDVAVEMDGPKDNEVNFALVNPMTGNIDYISNYGYFSEVSGVSYELYIYQGSPPAGFAAGQPISALISEECLDGPIAASAACCTEAFLTLNKITTQACPDNILIDIKLFNMGSSTVPIGAAICFYDGDPTVAGTQSLGSWTTDNDVAPGASRRFKGIDIGACMTSSEIIYAVLGDDCSGSTPIDLSAMMTVGFSDCSTSNNLAQINLDIPCGQYIDFTQN